MGPRLFSRGNVVTPSLGAVARCTLQWGRGCSAAEMARASSSKDWTSTLQWGRGCSAAEIPSVRGGPKKLDHDFRSRSW